MPLRVELSTAVFVAVLNVDSAEACLLMNSHALKKIIRICCGHIYHVEH